MARVTKALVRMDGAKKVDSLASALESAIHKSDHERSEMGERGRDWVKKDFAWPSIAKKWRSSTER